MTLPTWLSHKMALVLMPRGGRRRSSHLSTTPTTLFFLGLLCGLLFSLASSLIHDGATIDDVLRNYQIVSSSSSTSHSAESRVKRSTASSSSSSSSSSASSSSSRRYSVREERFSAFGKDFHLILSPRVGILASDFEAVSEGADGVEKPIALDGNNIAYEGRVVGESYSHVLVRNMTCFVP